MLMGTQVGDRGTLLPRSAVYGGTQLAEGVLLGSHCRPFRGQTISGDMEYNDTPCSAFITKKNIQEGKDDLRTESLSNMEPLTKPALIQIIRETLASIEESHDAVYSLPTDSSGMEEINLDSIVLVEFAVQLKRKTHVNIPIDAFFDLATVSDVADALLNTEQLKDEKLTDDASVTATLGDFY